MVGKLPIVWYDVAFMTTNVSAQLASVIYGLRFISVLKVPIFSYKFIDLGHELTYFLKYETKGKNATQKMKSFIVCWSYLSITYLSSSEGTFLDKSSAFLWEQTLPLSLTIFFFTPMRQSLFKNASKIIIKKKKYGS